MQKVHTLKDVTVIFQERIEALEHQSHEFPLKLRQRRDVRRLSLVGAPESLITYLESVRIPGRKWLVFGTEDAAEYVDSVIQLDLSWRQRSRINRLSMMNTLVYKIVDTLGAATGFMHSSLWDCAAGLALPIAELDESTLNEALQMQLRLGRFLTEGLAGAFGCFCLPCVDGWGIDIVWREGSVVNPPLSKVARRLVKRRSWEHKTGNGLVDAPDESEEQPPCT